MSRINYMQAEFLFGHIDADLIAFKYEYPGESLLLSISYYPFWLHPNYEESRRNSNPFGKIDWKAAKKTIDIYALGIRELKYQPSLHLTDLWTSAALDDLDHRYCVAMTDI